MLSLSLGARADAPLRLLCLGAHSDDIEIGCGGTLLRLLESHPGSSIDWIVFSASASDTRRAEAQASAQAFTAGAARANVVIHPFRESYFPHQASEIKDAFEELKKLGSPDLIFCHRLEDRHQDHRTLAELAWNTFRNHLICEYEIPKYEGDLGHPNVFVPLTRAQAKQKVSLLLESFASQKTRTWFRAETFEGLMSIRGIECNASEGFAEAFHARKLVL